MKSILDLSPEQLRRAAQIKDQIVSLEKQLQALLGQGAVVTTAKPTSQGGGMSQAARAKISAAMKARWAKRNAGKPASNPTQPAAKKRKPMSAAQRAQIAATLKARWAKIKAAKK